MNDRVPVQSGASDDESLEQQMAECGLSKETRRFLRNLHVAEKQLNDAFNLARQGGELETRVREVYREMYGTERRRTPRAR